MAGDSSGSGNNGTLMNGAAWTTSGKIGGALSFDGQNDEVVLDNFSDLDFSQENAFTFSAWVYPLGNNAGDIIFSRGGSFTNAGNAVYHFGVLNVDATRWVIRISDGTSILSADFTGSVSINQWQLISAIWDGSTLKLYKDGILIASRLKGSFTALWDGDTAKKRETSIGADGAEEYLNWNGKIDDMRVYSRALSAAEITALYNYTGGAATPAPVNGSCSTTFNQCVTGTFSDIADTGANYLWSCNGSNGGANTACSLPIPSQSDTSPPVINGPNTYYVLLTGVDTNPGTQAQPWRTIRKAATVALAGDTVVVGNGSFDEMVETKHTGTQANPITFRGSGQTIIQSFGIFHEWNNVDNFKITASNAVIYGAITFTASNIRITNNTIYNMHVMAIRMTNNGGGSPTVDSWPTNVYIGYNT